VTKILKTSDLSTSTTAALFEKLREHELEIIRLKEMKTTEKKNRSLSLKRNVADEEYNDEEPW